jgi:hypothetical protein
MHDWATLLAEATAPEEAPLAPVVVDAFLEGGRARSDLYASGGSVVGGFASGELALLLPAVLLVIEKAAPEVLRALASPLVRDVLETVKTSLSIVEIRARTRAAGGGAQRGRSAGAPTEAPATPSPAASPPAAGTDDLLRTLVQSMERELDAFGLKRDDRDLITYRTLRVLLSDPGGASHFVRALSSRA